MKSVEPERIFLSYGGRYLLFASTDEKDIYYINIFDIQEMTNVRHQTKCNKKNTGNNLQSFYFIDESMALLYEDGSENVYCSKGYQVSELLAHSAEVYDTGSGEIVLSKEYEDRQYLTGPLKGEYESEFIWQDQTLILDGQIARLFIDEYGDICIRKKDKDKEIIAEGSRQFEYLPETHKLLDINNEKNLICIDSDLDKRVDEKQAYIIGKNVDSFYLAPNSDQNLIIYEEGREYYLNRRHYLVCNNEKILLNTNEIDFFKLCDSFVVYEAADNKLYYRTIDQKSKKVGEEKCISEKLYDGFFADENNGWIIFWEQENGKSIPKYYDMKQDKVMALSPNIKEYDIVKVGY